MFLRCGRKDGVARRLAGRDHQHGRWLLGRQRTGGDSERIAAPYLSRDGRPRQREPRSSVSDRRKMPIAAVTTILCGSGQMINLDPISAPAIRNDAGPSK
jgi:hypothetical protein